MSVWKSIFIAEIRRVRVFFLIFLLLKAIFFAGVVIHLQRLEIGRGENWGILPTALLSIIVIIACLIGVMTFRSAWQDSPTRGASHLAFRPVRHRVVASAQLTVWLLLFAIPSALIEGLVIRHFGFPFRTMVIGSIQTGITTSLIILTAFWIGWMWETRAKLAAGVLLLMATYVHVFYLLGPFRHVLPQFILDGMELPQLLAIWVLIVACLAFLLLLLHARHPIRGWLRVLAAPAIVYTALLLASLIGTFLPKPAPYSPADASARVESHPPAIIVSAGYSKNSSRRDPPLLVVQPPLPATLPADEEVEWKFTEISANGSRIRNPRLDQTSLQRISSGSLSLAGYNALSRHLGDKLSIDRGIFSLRSQPAQTNISGKITGAELRDLSCKLRGTTTRWKISTDRPLRPSEANGKIMLDHRYHLWLMPQAMGDRYESYRHLRFLYSPTDGRLVELQPRGGLSYAGMSIGWMSPDHYAPNDRYYLGYRLIILRPETISALETTWAAQQPMPLIEWDGNSSPMSLHGPAAVKTFETWLAEHPRPATGSPTAVISAWLREFLPRIPMRGEKEIPGMREIIVSLADNHPIELLDALNGMRNGSFAARMTVTDFIPKSLLREAIHRHGNIHTSEKRSGPQPGDEKLAEILGPYAAQKTLRGESADVLETLFSVPEAVGLSHEEWLDLYRLYPSARSYNALRKVGVPEADLARETAGLLEHRFPLAYRENNVLVDGSGESSPQYHVRASVSGERDAYSNISKGSVPDIELALASGHPQAVEWYARSFQSLMNGKEIHLPSFSAQGSTTFTYATDSLRQYFVVPEDIPAKDTKRQISWFLDHSPADFVFDRSLRKFRLK